MVTRYSEFELRRLRLGGQFAGDELNAMSTLWLLPLTCGSGVRPVQRLVDLGAGRGAFLLAGALDGWSNITGIEIRADLALGLQRKLNGTGIQLIQGDIRSQPAPTGDLYIAAWTTWSPESRSAVLKQLADVPGGTRLWVWTHEVADLKWRPLAQKKVRLPGYAIQVFLYEKV